jgi:hypothetical protein
MTHVSHQQMRHAVTAAGCALAALLAAGCASSGGGAGVAGSSTASATPAVSPATPVPIGAAPADAATLAKALGVTRARLITLETEYLKIANPADRRLDIDNDGYADAEKDNLAEAKRFLLSEIATERLFDAELLRITFPPLAEQQARALASANARRITLTQHQAAAATLSALQAFNAQHKADDAAVEKPVRQLRAELGLPPPATSLPAV